MPSCINKSRLTLLSQLMASCVVLAACGGGAGTDGSVDGSSVAIDTSDSRQAAQSTDTPDASSGVTAAADPSVEPRDVNSEAYRRWRRQYGSGATTTTNTAAPAPAAAAATTATPAKTTVAAATPAPTPAPAPAAAAAVAAPVVATPTTIANGTQVTATFASTTMNMKNPERGFYGWGASYFNDLTASGLSNLSSQGLSLTLGLLNLSAYRSTSLPQSFLDTLTAKFALLRTAGIKVVLRPVYNYDASGSDASVALVKTQLQQLAPLFEANADVIAYVQAGFIGAWGEWHDSASGLTSDANKASIRDALMAAIPATHSISFRYPYDIIKWFPTALTSANGLGTSTQARAGVHNDCFMSSDNDVWTYNSGGVTNNPQRDYTKQQTDFVPFGGETCSGFGPTRQKCTDILSEGPAYHLTYLNNVFYTAFHNQWKSEGCFDQVSRSMGYRFQLDKVSHSLTAARNTTVNVDVDLHNVGWSRIFSARKLVVTLTNKTTGATIVGAGSTDMRTLPSQATASTRVTVPVGIAAGAAAGDYTVSVSMPDVYSTTANLPAFAVRFANADNVATAQAWNATNGKFAIGTTVTVQ
jgi:hypothetical protein